MINNNFLSDCGTGVVNPATALPATETQLLLITMDPVGLPHGVISNYKVFIGIDEGIVNNNNLIHVPRYRLEDRARAYLTLFLIY